MATILEPSPNVLISFVQDTIPRVKQNRKHARAIDEPQAADEETLKSKRTRIDSPVDCAPVKVSPSTHNAVMITSDRKYQLAPLPFPKELGEDEIMIRSRAVGLNHIDWKSVAWNFCLPDFPWVTGREMAGVVEEIGSGVSKVKVGDAVWTSTYYKDRRAGCFQEIVVVPQHTVFIIPDSINFTQAASLGVGGLTAAMTLWHWFGVPMNTETQTQTPTTSPSPSPISTANEVMLIWGGSTVTGQFAIQIAAQAGIEVIAVCSSSTSELVSNLGATHVVTYNDKTDFHIIGEILCLAQGRLTKAIDIVGHDTARQVLKVIAACGRPVEFAPLSFISSKDVVPSNAIVKSVEMKWFILDKNSEKYGARLNEMVRDGSVKIPEIRLLPGGLGGIEEGLLKLKSGTLAGKKLIVEV